jgi:hypothetical protein
MAGPSSPSSPAEALVLAAKEESSSLLNRIYSGIEYTNSQTAKKLPVMQSTRFRIPRHTAKHTPSSEHVLALSLLQSSPATIIFTSRTHTIFELGMPIPYMVAQGAGVHLIHTPHWWIGKSAAEMKAGPHGEEKDVRRAAAMLKGLETKRQRKVKKNTRKKEI